MGISSFPTLLSAVYWRDGSRIKEGLSDQEKQKLACRMRKKLKQLLPDGFGWLELPNWPGYRGACATRRSSCSWVKGSGMPLTLHMWAKGQGWSRRLRTRAGQRAKENRDFWAGRVEWGVPEAAGRRRCQRQDRMRCNSDRGGNHTCQQGKKNNIDRSEWFLLEV